MLELWNKDMVGASIKQHTMIVSEDNVANNPLLNYEYCSKFYYPDKRLQRHLLDIERN